MEGRMEEEGNAGENEEYTMKEETGKPGASRSTPDIWWVKIQPTAHGRSCRQTIVIASASGSPEPIDRRQWPPLGFQIGASLCLSLSLVSVYISLLLCLGWRVDGGGQ